MVKRKKLYTIGIDLVTTDTSTPGVTRYNWPEGVHVEGMPRGCRGLDIYGDAKLFFTPTAKKKYRGFLHVR